jgi:membrane protease YdiL (CAAX protease family)
VDVVSFILTMMAYIWLVLPVTKGGGMLNPIFAGVAVSMAALSLRMRGTGREQMGMSFKDFPSVLAVYVGASLAYAAVVLLYFRESVGLMERPRLEFWRVPWQLLWAFLQEYCLLAFLLTRLRQILHRDIFAVAAAAGIFAFCHLPNPFLTLYALGGGLIAGWLFLRWPSLPAATLAHAIASALVANLLPMQITGGMKVGPLYK